MPEGLEAEIWKSAVQTTIGRTVSACWVDERVADAGFVEAVTGATIEAVRRSGKTVLIDTDGPTVGLHFGMTGRVIVDGHSPIERLEYSSDRDDPAWDRLRMYTGGHPTLSTVPAIRMNDPRRLGRVSLDPDLSALGVDFSAVTAHRITPVLASRSVAIKTVLLDQSVIAGLGNMCADEVLWWAGIDPHRPASSLDEGEIGHLVTAIRRRLPIMLRRGGSHTGTITPTVRSACPPCPRDGGALVRSQIGGRTAVWCPTHQQ